MTTLLNANIDERVKNMDITSDEMKRIQTALKDEEFRKLFTSYAEEISNPENRKLYESEISQMESQRGMDVKFVNPTPGYVLKTSVDGTTKAFINVCTNDVIAKPTSKREPKGMNWKIPYSFSPVRDDVDKKGNNCKVFDFVIHPDTYRMSETNARFQQMIHDTCCEGINTSFSMQVDAANLKKINLKFKGVPTATVIRTEKTNFDKSGSSKPDEDDILSKFPYPYGSETSTSTAPSPAPKKKPTLATPPTSDTTTPKYTLTHRSSFDIQSTVPSLKHSSRPSHIVISVHLPLLKSSSQVKLDILEHSLKLNSDLAGARYNLDIQLPYPVDETEGTAKFDKKNHKLIITLPVVQLSLDEMPKISEEHTVEVISSVDNEPCPAESTTTSTKTSPSSPPPSSSDNGYDSDDDSGAPGLRVSTYPLDVVTDGAIRHLVNDHRIHAGDTIVYVARVKRVAKRSVKVATNRNGRVQIAFQSMGDGCFPKDYLTCIEFSPSEPAEDSNAVADKDIRVDVSVDDSIIVVKLPKTLVGVDNNLAAYSIGVDFNDLKTIQLPSRSAIESILKELKTTAEVKDQDQEETVVVPKLNVLRIDKEKLVIDIQAKKSSAPNDRSVSPVSPISSESPPILESPRLQGILRQRSITVSEPNEALFTSTTTDGDETSSEMYMRRRRTVSFSDYIDSTLFRNNDTITKMHNSLKNKRKNRRRKDQRKTSKDEKSKQSDCSDHENTSKTPTSAGKPHKKVKRGKKKCPSVMADSGSSGSYESTTSSSRKSSDSTSDNSPLTPDPCPPGGVFGAGDVLTSKSAADAKPLAASGVTLQSKSAVPAKAVDKVETMLSWADNTAPSEVTQVVPDMRFQFSNTAMFELDEA